MLKILKLQRRGKELKNKRDSLKERLEAYQKRKSDIEKSLEEAETDDDLKSIEEALEELEEEENLEGEIETLDEQIEEIETEIEELEEKSKKIGSSNVERKELRMTTHFRNMNGAEKADFVEREAIKGFLVNVRTLKKERNVTGGDLGVPVEMFDMLKVNISEESKLVKRVNVKPLKGEGRQVISGNVPEAVWTESEGILNELDVYFNRVEVDAYKVAGYICISNSILEDGSDIDLYNELLEVLGKSIAIALDKAILYGKGSKQPLGVVTRLEQKQRPENYSQHAISWEDLSESNIKNATNTNLTGIELFSEMLIAFSECNSDYTTANKVFCMNEKTKAVLVSKLLTFDASGTMVGVMGNKLPVLDGEIELFNFIPDGDVIGGYFDNYTLGERKETSIKASEEVRFIEDETVFRGVARYDGLPAIASAFALFKISANTINTVEFAEDVANTDIGIIAVTSSAGSTSGKTSLNVSPALETGNAYKYKISGDLNTPSYGQKLKGYKDWDGNSDIEAQTGGYIIVVETEENKAVKVGVTSVLSKE